MIIELPIDELQKILRGYHLLKFRVEQAHEIMYYNEFPVLKQQLDP